MTMPDELLSRDRAWKLVTEHVQSESLRKHLIAVEAAVRGYARMWGEDEEAWGFVALVHDFFAAAFRRGQEPHHAARRGGGD